MPARQAHDGPTQAPASARPATSNPSPLLALSWALNAYSLVLIRMPEPKLLETFPNPAPKRDYVIEHTHHVFTSLCPMTGHPDFAHITVRYVPDKTCVELKSLKIYFHAFRNEGIFFEAVTNKICDDLGAALKPRRLTIVADWKARGGFTSVVTAEWSPRRGRT